HIKIKPGVSSAIHRFKSKNSSKPIFMIHGSMESGRIFYSKKGMGFGPYLAKRGYDVFIVDLPGRGESFPLAGKELNYGQTELIIRDVNLYLKFIQTFYPNQPVDIAAHSWGGVIMLAWYARCGKRQQINSMVFF